MARVLCSSGGIAEDERDAPCLDDRFGSSKLGRRDAGIDGADSSYS